MKQKNNENMVSVLDYMYKTGISVKKGIERLAKVYCWPNVPTTADKDKYEFRALIEFVIFNVYVKKTFFTILHADLRNQTANLYRHLLSSVKDNTPSLSFKEAFLLFRLIGKKQTRSILDAISCPPSTYNGILESIENLDYELFVSSFEDYDNRQTFQVLWQVRYILYGTNYAWDHSKPTEQLSSSCFNEWSRDEDKYQSYFSEIPEKYEDDFVRQKVLDIIGFEDSSKKKRRIRCPNHSSSYEAFVDEYIHYSEKESGKSLFFSQWKDLLTEYSGNSNLPLGKSWVNRPYVENIARLILTHNVILHKDKAMEIYGIDSSEMYNEFINSEVYIYESEDCKDFGRYILYYTGEIQNIYKIVKDLIPDHKRKNIQLLLDRYPKKDNEPDITADIHTTNHKKGKKPFVRVLDSKLKGKTSEEKNTELLRCLSLLYEELTKESSNLIDTTTPKDLFIYRFSGFNGPFRPEIKIFWKGSHTFLGYITRCLISDKTIYPVGLGDVTSFFHSKSGKKMNLSVTNCSFKDYEREKDSLHQEFTKAVELLRKCGFVNVEFTSSRR